jgi:hypothetical protein
MTARKVGNILGLMPALTCLLSIDSNSIPAVFKFSIYGSVSKKKKEIIKPPV